jgi:hypothetical protein
MSGPQNGCPECDKFKGDIVHDLQIHCDRCGEHIPVYPDVIFGMVNAAPEYYRQKDGTYLCEKCRNRS